MKTTTKLFVLFTCLLGNACAIQTSQGETKHVATVVVPGPDELEPGINDDVEGDRLPSVCSPLVGPNGIIEWQCPLGVTAPITVGDDPVGEFDDEDEGDEDEAFPLPEPPNPSE